MHPASDPPAEEEFLHNLQPGDERQKDIYDILSKSFLSEDPDFSSRWKPVLVQLVQNEILEKEFEAKEKDLCLQGRSEEEREVKYGFVCCTEFEPVSHICTIGLQTQEDGYNAMGYNRMGVYVCKHADVCIKQALCTPRNIYAVFTVVCKYKKGRSTTAVPRLATAPGFIEPTRGYDSHVSALPPADADPVPMQFARSSLYLYEVNKFLQPVARPRQVLPVAVVTYTPGGIPLVPKETECVDKLASNPKLQQLVKEINAKGNPQLPKQGVLSEQQRAAIAQKVAGNPKLEEVVNAINSRDPLERPKVSTLATYRNREKLKDNAKLLKIVEAINAKPPDLPPALNPIPVVGQTPARPTSAGPMTGVSPPKSTPGGKISPVARFPGTMGSVRGHWEFVEEESEMYETDWNASYSGASPCDRVRGGRGRGLVNSPTGRGGKPLPGSYQGKYEGWQAGATWPMAGSPQKPHTQGYSDSRGGYRPLRGTGGARYAPVADASSNPKYGNYPASGYSDYSNQYHQPTSKNSSSVMNVRHVQTTGGRGRAGANQMTGRGSGSGHGTRGGVAGRGSGGGWPGAWQGGYSASSGYDMDVDMNYDEDGESGWYRGMNWEYAHSNMGNQSW